MNKKTQLPIIFSLLVLIICIFSLFFINFFNKPKTQEIRVKAAPSTTLTFSPTSLNKLINETFNLEVKINTGGNLIYGAHLEVIFDSQKLLAQDIQPGDFFTSAGNPLIMKKDIASTPGKIIYSLGMTTEKQGTGTAATITFKSIAGGTANLSFGTSTSVAAKGESEGLSSASSTATVNIQDKVSLNFKVKFQEITTQKPDKQVKITLKKDSQEQTGNVTVKADQNGIYSGTFPNINLGTYDVYIKGTNYLQKKFTNVSLVSATNTKDWTSVELLAGDANGDNEINIQDFLVLQQSYLQTAQNLPADFDSNGTINIQDFKLLAQNYNLTGE